jgi:arylsulfatase A-like enzyme
MDLFPTLAEAAGAAAPAGLDGRSLLPTLLGRPQPPEDRSLFFTRLEAGMGGKTIDAVRRGDWKLLRNKPGGPLELYNLKDDPQERRNLLAGGPRPAVADELDAALQDQLRKARAVPWQPPA